MDPDASPSYPVAPGMTAVGADSQKIGKIVDATREYILVEKGFFFPADYYIPAGEIVDIVGDQVFLRVTKDEVAHMGWDQPPVPAAGSAEHAEHAGSAGSAETIRVPVYAEELTAVTRDVDRGAILIEKELVTEQRTITVPVTEERVRVTRVPVGTPGSVGAEAFENGAIEIPVRGQEVDVEKTARMTGEVVVEKERVEEVKRFDATVRREDVRVEGDGDLLEDNRDPRRDRRS